MLTKIVCTIAIGWLMFAPCYLAGYIAEKWEFRMGNEITLPNILFVAAMTGIVLGVILPCLLTILTLWGMWIGPPPWGWS